MTRVWSCGFELQSAAAGMEWDGTAGTPTITTTPALVRSGSAALRCTTVADTAYIQQRVSASETAPWAVRLYVLVQDLPDVTTSVIEAVDDANLVVVSVRLTPAGVLQLHDDHEIHGGQIGGDSDPLTVGEWHRVELGIRPLNYGGEALLDGAPFASTAAWSTGENVNRFRMGVITPCTTDLVLDDLAISTGLAAVPVPLRQNSFDGPDETAVTVGNSASYGDAFSSVDSPGVTYEADTAYYGAACLRLDYDSASNGLAWQSLALGDCALRVYVNRGTAEAGNLWWSPGPGTASLGAGGDITWDALVLSDVLPENTWCRVEATRSGTTGTLRVWSTDPESTGDPDAETSGTVDGSEITQWWLEHMGAAVLFDLWAIDDEATELGPVAVPDYPGSGRIIHLAPAGPGDNTQWSAGTGGGDGAWSRVDETTPDDADSYNQHTVTGSAVDDFALGASGLADDATVRLVQVGARLGSTAATGTRDLALRIKGEAAGSVTTGSTVSCAVDGWATHTSVAPAVYSLTSTTNPATSSAWTPAALGTAQIGYGTVTSSALPRRVSALWLLVEYLDGPTSTPDIDTLSAPGARGAITGSPALIVEAAFTAASAVANVLHLDDEVRGTLDDHVLGADGESFTDISAWVRSASTSRGADRVTSPVISYDAGTGQVVLDNRDRRFDPTHLGGPYVIADRSQVSPMRPMRIRARWGSTTNLVTNPHFESEGTTGWEAGTGTTIDAVSDPVGIGYFGPHALAITRTSAEATHTVTTTDAGLRGGAVGDDQQVTLSVYVRVPGAVHPDVTGVTLTGYDSIGNTVFATATAGVPVADTWERVSATATLTGSLYSIEIGVTATGGTGVVLAYLDGAQAVAGAVPEVFYPPETIYPLLRGYATTWGVAWDLDAPRDGTTTASISDAFRVLANWDRAAAETPAGAGEDSGARITRILDGIDWPDGDRLIDTGDTTLQATDTSGLALDEMQAVAETEVGELYVDGHGRLRFRNRAALYTEERSARPQAILGDAPDTGELPYSELTISYDDTTLVNHVVATREGGTAQTAQDTESQAQYLTRTWTADNLLMQDDDTALAYAQFVLHTSREPELRFESVTILPLRDPGRLMPLALGTEVGDRLRIRRRPPGGGDRIERDVIVRGIAHEATPHNGWRATFALQSATKASFLVLDEPELGRLDHNALGY